jgi:cytochrome c biogenesis protein CcmG/thiol:disulfide interchange protein DsbE
LSVANENLGRLWRYFLPLAIFFGLVFFLWRGLSLDPHVLPSALMNKPAPQFSLTTLQAPDKTLSTADMKGQVWVLNVWGSWCVSCRYEHPVLNELAKEQVVPIIGLNWKDKPEDATIWLAKFGNPYQTVITDPLGRAAIDLGVTAAPETFIIDKAGTIRYKQPGPISPEEMRDVVVPLIRDLKKA